MKKKECDEDRTNWLNRLSTFMTWEEVNSRGFLQYSEDVHASSLHGFLNSSSNKFCLQTNLKPSIHTSFPHYYWEHWGPVGAEPPGRHKSGVNSNWILGHWIVSSWVHEEESRVWDRLTREGNSLVSWEVWSFLLIDLQSSLASPGSPLVSSDFCSLKGEGHMDVCVCMHACVHTCVPGSVWAIWSPSLSLCSSLRVITASGLQIQPQWANSQPFPHQLCDLGQGAQPLCASVLICDTGW